MWLQAGNETQHQGVCPFTSIIKVQTVKARLLGIKSVSLLDRNFHDLGKSWKAIKGYRACILSHVMKTTYNFLEKSELPEFILPVKISWLFFCGFRGGNEKLSEIRVGWLSRHAVSSLDFALAATLVIQCALVSTLRRSIALVSG